MDKPNPWVNGISAAITFSILYTVCAVTIALFPEPGLNFFNAWFHGLDLSLLRTKDKPFTLAMFIYGLLGVAITTYLMGALYAAIYNLVSSRSRRAQSSGNRLAH